MAQKKTKIQAEVWVNAYGVIADAVEQGVHLGYNRAFKHTDAPDEQLMRNKIEDAVLECLTEVLIFPDAHA